MIYCKTNPLWNVFLFKKTNNNKSMFNSKDNSLKSFLVFNFFFSFGECFIFKNIELQFLEKIKLFLILCKTWYKWIDLSINWLRFYNEFWYHLFQILLFVDLQWIVLHWSGKSINNNNKYNEYNYNPAAIIFQCIFAWLLFTKWLVTYYLLLHLIIQI